MLFIKKISVLSLLILWGSASFANPLCVSAADEKLAKEFSLPPEICVNYAQFQSPESADEFVWVNLKGNPYSMDEGWGRYMEGEQGETLIATIVDSRDHECGGKIHTVLYLRLNARGEYYGIESGKSYMETYTQPNLCPKLQLSYK